MSLSNLYDEKKITNNIVISKDDYKIPMMYVLFIVWSK